MTSIKYDIQNLSKYFIRRHYIFKNISFSFTNGDVVAVTGANGSGKSTLLKVLAGVLSYSSGELEIFKSDTKITQQQMMDNVALVAPYLNLYEEFTPLEHYKLSAELRGCKLDLIKFNEHLDMFKLSAHKNSQIRNFSSGMKQRMKFILALQKSPIVLFLDEPTSNLDTEGINTINDIIKRQSQSGACVVIATNEDREKELCSKFVDISNEN
ncbi:MAG: ABC transporter ATP-binding protein [Candidatus Kapaibacterium sp.]|jgi:heme exporter protein A|nr:ABC transporter ATP-binding protein [Candidatus Kapabacteria bacterium]